MRALKSGLLYFAVVFGVGLALGPIRMIYVVPRLDSRWSELLEMPIMLAVTVLAARRTIRRFAVPPTSSSRLGMGFLALVLMLIAEFALVLRLRGMPITEYLVTRDPVSGTAYYITLIAFALMPLFVARK
jgi:hypothetical protein